MKGNHLGELEELILLAVLALEPNAYGVAVMDEIKMEAGRSLTISATHTVLRRMEDKGYLTSEMGGGTKTRGGRKKRLYKLVALGQKKIEELREIRLKFYNRAEALNHSLIGKG